jgi:hypothetical protein
MPLAQWALLPRSVSAQSFYSLEQKLAKQTLKEFLRDAGLRTRRDQGQLRLRTDLTDHRPLLELHPLQDPDGSFRSEAERIIAGANSLSGIDADIQAALPRLLSQPGAQPEQDLNYWGRLQLALWSTDPITALRGLHAGRRNFAFG